MKIRVSIQLVLMTSALSLQAAEPVIVSSPDKKVVVAWVDSSLGQKLPHIRSIVIARFGNFGDVFFSKVTTPRSSRASWSPDSSKCLLYDAPDNGNVSFWILASEKSKEEPWAVKEIHPMEGLYKSYAKRREKQWDNTLWRPYCSEMKWIDGDTIILAAADNDGEYRLTVKLSDPNHPQITKIKDRLH